MAGRDRERRLAREHYERQQAQRAAAAARARRRNAVAAAVLAVALVIAAAVALTFTVTGGQEEAATTPATTAAATAPSSAPSPSPSTTRTAPAADPCPAGTPAAAATPASYPSAPEPTLRAATYAATVKTSCGAFEVELLAKEAPRTVASFEFLARRGFFRETPCHRLTTEGIFVLQCGDPTGSGSGGPGYTIPLENPPKNGRYPAGTLAMARATDPDSGGSQFFVVYDDTTLPAPGYAIFGRVTKGLDVIRRIAAGGVAGGGGDGPPATPVVLESVTVDT